jgi:hypothetical protein
LSIFILLTFSCNQVKKVPPSLIEESIIAHETWQHKWETENGYWENEADRNLKIEDSTSFTQDERELLADMLMGNYSYTEHYSGNKATIIVDYSQSGITEWKNRNKFGLQDGHSMREDVIHEIKNHKIQFIYENNRWYVMVYPQLDWPSADDEPQS